MRDNLRIGDREFSSRLFVGTGKYRSFQEMARCHAASGAEVVTVAVRRVNLDRADEEGILHHLDADRYLLLPNTAGCYSAQEAVRFARLSLAAGFTDWVKPEVIGDQETLLPDVVGRMSAGASLILSGILAVRREEIVNAAATHRLVLKQERQKGEWWVGLLEIEN